MRYTLASFLYWPVWLSMAANGQPWFGILAGTILVLALWLVMWYVSSFSDEGEL